LRLGSTGAGKAERRRRRRDLPRRRVLHRRGSAQSGRPEKSGEESERQMKLRVPKGACDTHMHFYDEAMPAAPGTFLPGTFTVEDYRALQRRLGLERVIVVQANAYADDNSIAVNAIRALGKGAKG